jgi:hypothetical protein
MSTIQTEVKYGTAFISASRLRLRKCQLLLIAVGAKLFSPLFSVLDDIGCKGLCVRSELFAQH